ncbi:MAG: ligase-associated DNA damage response exonuclease [Verrucomicrobiae bacterium]|nr:ligase-associated DNA damage response exonuclease [Verrucomicrobiae bacterium]
MLTLTDSGLYCAAGNFFIDPWRSVERALITHAHSDHARSGSTSYLCAREGVGVLRTRLGSNASITGLPCGERLRLGDVTVSFHPAGHILGSAQIRLERDGEIWVASGDYKLHPDPTCTPFEPVPCHTFITESTFGLPVYRWPAPDDVLTDLHAWWRTEADQDRVAVLFAYSLGKAQRLLAGLQSAIGPIFVHDAIHALLPAYADAGVRLPPVQRFTPDAVRASGGRALVLAPPSADPSAWLNTLGDLSTAVASGWMTLRGPRRRRGVDRGFVLSDHADWPSLLAAIRATGATRILVTHGTSAPLVRWLAENGWQAKALSTRFLGDAASESSPVPATSSPTATPAPSLPDPAPQAPSPHPD